MVRRVLLCSVERLLAFEVEIEGADAFEVLEGHSLAVLLGGGTAVQF